MSWSCRARRRAREGDFPGGADRNLVPTSCLISFVGLVALSGCARVPQTVEHLVERGDFVLAVRAEGNLSSARTTLVSVPQTVSGSARIAWLERDGVLVDENQVIARFDATQMREQLADGRSDLEASDLKQDKASVQGETRIAGIDKDKEVAERELDVAERYQRTDSEIYSRMEIAESELDSQLAVDRRDHATRMRGIQEDLSAAELALLEVEEKRVSSELERAASGLAALEVRAPHAGLLVLRRDRGGDPLSVGAQVWRGHPIAEIPDLSVMQAEVFVLEADAGGLQTGRRASVRLSARPEAPIDATIKRVEPVARRRFRGSPVQYFGVVLELEQSDPALMKPGQRVEATLFLEEREGVVVVPRQAVFVGDGDSAVWVRSGSGFVERTVELGPQSAAFAVIESGLEPGEVIALERPNQPGASPRDHSGGNSSALDGVGG